MAHIELPRALEDYFAFAETTPTRNGRRFVISLPYFSGASTGVCDGKGSGAKLDRLQWWFHLGPEQERQMGEAAVATVRAQATEKFCRHIERWLQNTRQCLHGEDPIPHIDALAEPAPEVIEAPAATAAVAAPVADNVVAWPAEKVANG